MYSNKNVPLSTAMRSARERDRLWWLASTKKSHVYETRLRGECYKLIWNYFKNNKTHTFSYFRPKWTIIIQTTCKKVNNSNKFSTDKKSTKRQIFIRTKTSIIFKTAKKQRRKKSNAVNFSSSKFIVRSILRSGTLSRLPFTFHELQRQNEIWRRHFIQSNSLILSSIFRNYCNEFD